MVARIIGAIGCFWAGALLVWFLINILHGTGYLIIFPKGSGQLEVLSLFLATATLVIGAVAIIVAIAAVVGYTSIRSAAVAAGREAGDKAARELLAPIANREDILAQLATRPQDDRTDAVAAALAERGNDVGPTAD